VALERRRLCPQRPTLRLPTSPSWELWFALEPYAIRNSWIRLSLDAWSLGIEASSVIGLRTLMVAAGGPAARQEMGRMVSEKVDAALQLQARALTGGLGLTPQSAAGRTLTHYRRKVRANRRRLSKSPA
jgi:hypothetical protein